MFRTLLRSYFPNPFDRKLKKLERQGKKKILLVWNRGLGDIPLGIYAMVHRISEIVREAKITILTRESLREGFSLLQGVEVAAVPGWKRKDTVSALEGLAKIGRRQDDFDYIFENPNPTQWVSWQLGKLQPKLAWKEEETHMPSCVSFSSEYHYIGVQIEVESGYNFHRNWPKVFWDDLLVRLSFFPNVRILLLGEKKGDPIEHPHCIDLRGKTTLKEVLSLIQKHCAALLLPDSGLLSLCFYLDVSFPIRVVSLWSDPFQGVLKQAVASPNPQLSHFPLIARNKNLATISVSAVMDALFDVKPLDTPFFSEKVAEGSLQGVGAILLAGGQGSRLGTGGVKGKTVVLGKSLFAWILERAPSQNFPIAVMVAPSLQQETMQFFQENNYFGKEIYFFSQEELPFLTDGGAPFVDKGKIVVAPNGNGDVYRAFHAAGLGSLFMSKGVRFLHIVPVDNPLADIADGKLLSLAKQTGADVVVKAIRKSDTDTSMGVLVERGGRLEIQEYFSLDPKKHYSYAYTGMLAMTLPFFLSMARVSLPLHLVPKKVPKTSATAWKQEKFLFDVLPYAKKSVAIAYPREHTYAPVKTTASLPETERKILACRTMHL